MVPAGMQVVFVGEGVEQARMAPAARLLVCEALWAQRASVDALSVSLEPAEENRVWVQGTF